MEGRFPRTPNEFLEHGRRVAVRCTSCWAVDHVDPQVLIQLLGSETDIYGSFPELKSKLSCGRCYAV
jgi:hypothetical protein